MLTLAYIALAAIGCMYVVVSLLLGHVFDAFGHGGDAGAGAAHGVSESYGIDATGHGSAMAGDGGAATFHFPRCSPLALATLAGTVGGLGLMTRHGLGWGDGASLALSLPLGFAITYAVTYMTWRMLAAASTTSTIQTQDLVGAPAEILTPIPEGGLGEVAALARGQRYTAPARAAHGRALGRGATVKVVGVSGSTLIVAEEPRGDA